MMYWRKRFKYGEKKPRALPGGYLSSINAIDEYTRNLTEADFYQNGQVQDAVTRRLEIIGEAAKSLEEEFRRRYPELP
ncbi:MAG: hypothetical protein PWP04_1030 [Candidatus Atribacteria bacterium]|nr:hypothetical protein [Candidatus Atribacteria bacterium]